MKKNTPKAYYTFVFSILIFNCINPLPEIFQRSHFDVQHFASQYFWEALWSLSSELYLVLEMKEFLTNIVVYSPPFFIIT